MKTRILVVCYAGNEQTRIVAEAIAQRCDADLEWIKDRDNRLGLPGRLRSVTQALLCSTPWIQPVRYPPAAYSLVIIGTPVWAWSMASPVRSYLERYAGRCRRVAFFCTHQGMGADRVLAALQGLCSKQPAATLALPHQNPSANEIDSAVEHFVRRFNGHRGDTVFDARLAA